MIEARSPEVLVVSNDPWSSAPEYFKGKRPKRKWAEKEAVGAPVKWDTNKAVTELDLGGFLNFKRQINNIVEQLIPWYLKFVADCR